MDETPQRDTPRVTPPPVGEPLAAQVESVSLIDPQHPWESVLASLIILIRHGDYEGRQFAAAELRRMSQLADLWATRGNVLT